MKRSLRSLCLLLLALTLAACSTGKKALQRGDYFDSCLKAVERLKADPDNKKARETLSEAYSFLLSSAARDIAEATAKRTLAGYDKAINIYGRLDRVADAIYKSPAALRVIPEPAEYGTQQRELMEIAGQMYYDEGVAALARGTLQDARTALSYLTRAGSYTPGYRDVKALTERARYQATMRVIVLRPYTNPRYRLDAEFFYTKLMSQLAGRKYKNLVRFYTPEEAEALGMHDPHQLLVLNFEDFTIGNTRESSKTLRLTKEGVLVGTTVVNGQRQDVYGPVRADFTTYRREIISSGVLSVRILDPATQRVLSQKNLAGTTTWYTEWAGFNGDERALSAAQLRLAGQKPVAPPAPQALFADFVSPLYSRAESYIASVY